MQYIDWAICSDSSTKHWGYSAGVGNTGHIPPPQPSSYLPALVAYLLSGECKKMHKISGGLAIISMNSDERTIIFCFGIVVIRSEMPKVGVINRLRMRTVHYLVKFPPPFIALYLPLQCARFCMW